MASLAVAMGVGRFAFTPILPMMLAEGSIDLHGASGLATANYLGYLIGAILCTLQPAIWARWAGLPQPRYASLIRFGLVSTVALTLAMGVPVPATWPVLRGLAGVSCAIAFVYTSGWCLARVAEQGKPGLGGLIFVGPGAGIVISGLIGSAMSAHQWPGAWAWGALAALGAGLMLAFWPVFRGGPERLGAAGPRVRRDVPGPGSSPGQGRVSSRVVHVAATAGERWLLALTYGLAGFGYIITATFLPVIAREALGPSRWIDLFWPIFGAAIMVGAFGSAFLPAAGDQRHRLMVGYLLQAAGVALTLFWPSAAGFAIGSILLGLPMTALSFFAMQEARRLQPESAAALMGLLTALYGVGQISGPPLVAWQVARSASAGAGFDAALSIAAATLLVGAALYGWMIRRYPLADRAC